MSPGAPHDGHHVLVGIGSPDRGDDAIGPAVVGLVARWVAGAGMGVTAPGRQPLSLPRGTQILSRCDPTQLIDVLAGADLAVVVDAVRTGAPPGTLQVLETGADQPPLPHPPAASPSGTHGLGLADALELARVLGILPRRVVVVGVEAGHVELGAPMSPAVVAALEPTARAALHALGHDDPFDVAGAVGLPHPAAGNPSGPAGNPSGPAGDRADR